MSFEEDYKDIVPSFIANGQPSQDTVNKYFYEIDNWLTYCADNNYDPITDISEQDARDFINFLNKKQYAPASINIKLAAVKLFYFVAEKLKLINENPFKNIKPKPVTYDDSDFNFLTKQELQELCKSLAKSKNLTACRNLAIVMFMAVEGLRTVEIHRMSDEDFNFKNSSILIHGKGRDAYIYPCKDTFAVLEHYKAIRPQPIGDQDGTPTFIGLATKYYARRITRTGIRFAINHVLESVIERRNGESCHMLRHTCGTNLYAETKDIRLVQETLRQRNPNVTARYAHIQERINDRQTSNISPFEGGFDIDSL